MLGGVPLRWIYGSGLRSSLPLCPGLFPLCSQDSSPPRFPWIFPPCFPRNLLSFLYLSLPGRSLAANSTSVGTTLPLAFYATWPSLPPESVSCGFTTIPASKSQILCVLPSLIDPPTISALTFNTFVIPHPTISRRWHDMMRTPLPLSRSGRCNFFMHIILDGWRWGAEHPCALSSTFIIV